jgi:hypothetical protein
MLVQLAYGAQIYQWYPNWVRGSTQLFPKPISGTCVHDSDWGLGTKEIRAWTNSTYWLLLAYGWATLSWSANTFADQEGGIPHMVFYRTSQVMTWVPFVTMMFALNVKKSYAATQSRYAADITANPTVTAACKQTWLFDDSVVNFEAYNFRTNATNARILYMFATALLSLFMSIYTMDDIRIDYENAREWAEMMEANEASETPEEETAEPTEEEPEE